MLVFILLALSTLGHEIAYTIGKKAVAKRRESVYALCFLHFFWAVVLLMASVLLGAEFKVTADSIPTMSVRIILECLLAYLGARALISADRSTIGFLGTLTIPMLLVADLAIGYNVNLMQIAGMALLLFGTGILFVRSKSSKRGVKFVVAASLTAVVTASLLKYNITNFNSVPGEQIVVLTSVMLFYSILAKIHRVKQPILLIAKPLTGTQSFSEGVAMAIESFAFLFAPPSVIIALKRGLTLVWSIIFGHRWFHEHKLKLKLKTATIVLAGLAIITLF